MSHISSHCHRLLITPSYPFLFYSGDDLDGFGSCYGDSGGPVFKLDRGKSTTPHFVQLGLVQGGVGACGDWRVPGVYVRIGDPEILGFIETELNVDDRPSIPGVQRRQPGIYHILASMFSTATSLVMPCHEKDLFVFYIT